jgi:putative membrane protein
VTASGKTQSAKVGTATTVRLWFAPERLSEVGETPDYRFSLANERTFLAWLRTALALMGGGFAVAQFLTDLHPRARFVLTVLLLTVGVMCAVWAVNHWIRVERAMRLGQNLPVSRFPSLLALAIGAMAVIMVVAVAIGWVR